MELREYFDRLVGRWTAWSETDGVADLVLMNRLAGPGAVVTSDGFDPRVDLPPLRTVRSGAFVFRAFDAFMTAHLCGESDPRNAALERVLALPRLFNDEPVNADAAQLELLVTEVQDLHALNGRVRDDARREDVVTVMELFESRVLPAPATDARDLIVAAELYWPALFWWDALELCFPSMTAVDHVAAILPEALAERVLRSILDLDPEAQVATASLPDDVDGSLAMAAALALLGNGCAAEDAVETALAVMS